MAQQRPLGKWVVPTFLLLIPVALLAGFYIIVYGRGEKPPAASAAAPVHLPGPAHLPEPLEPPRGEPAPPELASRPAPVSSLDMLRGGSDLMETREAQAAKPLIPEAPAAPAKQGKPARKKQLLKGKGSSSTGAGWNWEH